MSEQKVSASEDLRTVAAAGIASGVLGLAGVGIAALADLRIPPPPPPPDFMRVVAMWHLENRSALTISLALGGLSVSFFIWFAAGLSASLRRSAGNSQAAAALAAATASSILVMTGLVCRAVLNYSGAAGGEEFVMRALYDLAGFFTAFAAFPSFVFLFITARSLMKSRALPMFVSAGGLVVAVASLLSAGAALGADNGGHMAGGGLLQLGVMAATLIWTLATGISMFGYRGDAAMEPKASS